MNTITLYLSSTTAAHIEIFPLLEMDDYTSLTINTDRIYEQVVPAYVKIDWGDNTSTTTNNFPLFQNDLNVLKFSSALNANYTHEYYPSTTALYKLLSAQVLIRYTNTDIAWFLIPIQIKTYGYVESIEDMDLINTNILPVEENSAEHQFKTSKDGYIIELRKD